ncbi:hypothetical protein B0H10DRAFT_1937913 [Mycena sp. CBHHK59/15]|nr:hypothetical protein B0H10DRAFT_1937913 [Mycena sp. CBHHK59/15]
MSYCKFLGETSDPLEIWMMESWPTSLNVGDNRHACMTIVHIRLVCQLGCQQPWMGDSMDHENLQDNIKVYQWQELQAQAARSRTRQTNEAVRQDMLSENVTGAGNADSVIYRVEVIPCIQHGWDGSKWQACNNNRDQLKKAKTASLDVGKGINMQVHTGEWW